MTNSTDREAFTRACELAFGTETAYTDCFQRKQAEQLWKSSRAESAKEIEALKNALAGERKVNMLDKVEIERLRAWIIREVRGCDLPSHYQEAIEIAGEPLKRALSTPARMGERRVVTDLTRKKCTPKDCKHPHWHPDVQGDLGGDFCTDCGLIDERAASFTPSPVTDEQKIEVMHKAAWDALHNDAIFTDESRNEFIGRNNSTKAAWIDVAVRSALRELRQAEGK